MLTLDRAHVARSMRGVREAACVHCARGFVLRAPPRVPSAPQHGAPSTPDGHHQRRAVRVHAVGVSSETVPTAAPSTGPVSQSPDALFEFVCPICLTTPFQLPGMPSRPGSLSCPRCARAFSSSAQYVDLTLTSGAEAKVYQQEPPPATQLFRSPLVSFAYERGWRQGFNSSGFPGVEREFQLAMDLLTPAYGKVLVDMSCGSGLFSRRFARSGKFSGVVAADFSESMLAQTREYCREDGTLRGSTPLVFLRADVGRLPFATGSLAALHAGAALHCWPNPQLALAEISRVLAPGGVFVASTFLLPTAVLGQIIGDELVRPLNKFARGAVQDSTGFRYWEEVELRELCTGAGLQRFERMRDRLFVLLAAYKPS